MTRTESDSVATNPPVGPAQAGRPVALADRSPERIYALLDRVGMTPAAAFADRYPRQLSGRETQRVACFREDDAHEYWDSPELTD